MTQGSAEMSYNSLAVGDEAAFDQHIEVADVNEFAKLSGDRNELHTDEGYAATTEFGRRVVHGMYLGALVSQLVGMYLPGRYSLLVRSVMSFHHPVFCGEHVSVGGKVVHKSDATRIVELAVVIRRGNVVVADGNVHVRMLR